MVHRRRLLSLCLSMSLLMTTHSTAAMLYSHEFNLLGNYTDHLIQTTNARVYPPHQFWNYTYWGAIHSNKWTEVIYGYYVPFPINGGEVNTTVLTYGSGSAFIEVSTDMQVWHRLAGDWNNDAIANHIPIGTITRGTSTFFVRARFLTQHASSLASNAAFAETDTTNPDLPTYSVVLTSQVPEPTALSLAIMVLIIIGIYKSLITPIK